MASSFKSIDLFGSGPHRFVVGERGVLTVPLSVLSGDSLDPRVVSGDLRPLRVDVIGRLVAASEAALGVLRSAVLAQVTDPPQVGALVLTDGRSFAGLSLTSYEEEAPVDRGRVWSVGYVAGFRVLTT